MRIPPKGHWTFRGSLPLGDLVRVRNTGCRPTETRAARWKPRPNALLLSSTRRRDASWADTMDTLRVPRSREQKFWDWRRSSPIRPVVFEDPGVVTEEVAQLHLEQRVVQRLLGRFTAQGFVFHDLSRACLAQTTDSIPRVLLIGRLALYGPGAARLHEKLIPITARWSDPMIRKGSLVPYGREAETKTLALLDQSLIRPESHAIPDVVKAQLKEAAARDVQELLPHLESRAAEYATDAIALLPSGPTQRPRRCGKSWRSSKST